MVVAALTLPGLVRAQTENTAAVEAFNQGTTLLRSGQQREAIAYFDEAIRLNPSFSDAYTNRGSAYGNLGQHQRAIKDYDEAIRLNPGNAAAYTNRCSTLQQSWATPAGDSGL